MIPTPFELAPLGSICDLNPRLPKESRPADTDLVSFVPMAAVDEESASIGAAEIRAYSAVKKGFTPFRDNDVLFAKITPCMENGKVALATGLHGGIGFGSTEFHVLRASARVLPEWLRYYVLRPSFRSQAKRRMSGAVGQQRVPAEFLSESLIPIPPVDEQRKLVELLARAENIVRMRREAEQKAKEIIPALFLDMFGDPGTNPKGWEVRHVGDVIRSAEYGTSTKASDDGSGLPVIRMGNVEVTGRLSLTELKYVVLPEAEQLKYALETGDILFNRTNSKELVGKTGIWRPSEPAVAASYFIRVRVNEDTILPDYFWAFMNTRHMKSVLYSTARGAIGQSNINAQELRALAIPCPPTSLQQTFARRTAEALDLEQQQRRASETGQTTFQSLLAGVFSVGCAT